MMSLTCKAVIFDLDGVLVDSNAVVERHWERWAERRGIPFEKIAAIHHGRPTVEVIREVAPHLDAQAEADRKELTESDDTEGLRMFDGADTLVGAVPEERWTIATSGRRQTATRRLEEVGLPIPEQFVTADDVSAGKPAPEPYELAAQYTGMAPADCIVLEDAPAGIESAHRAGARVIAVASTNPPEALSAADGVVSNIQDVMIEFDGRETLAVRWKPVDTNGRAE